MHKYDGKYDERIDQSLHIAIHVAIEVEYRIYSTDTNIPYPDKLWTGFGNF